MCVLLSCSNGVGDQSLCAGTDINMDAEQSILPDPGA
ncbi:uncharacterized protein G2W53_030647 [Senna tora]|uniref:Uncharacterized protein n=1 Tax=Senna tora TaxID=362788 RepID=A0A834WD53_9FABA|nr:uncharacterized protein G2W53_030647 [Senna tora]